MKRMFKVASSVLAGLLVAAMLFGAGAYASEQGWLKFKDEQITQSNGNVDKIMEILREVDAGKKTAEKALAEIEKLNPKGLAEQNKNLREQVKNLENEVKNKQNEVNNKQTEINNKQKEVEQKQTEIHEKNQSIDALQQERDQIAAAHDNAIAERDAARADLESANNLNEQNQTELTLAEEKVEYYEAELIRANEAVTNHNNNTEAALEEAKTIGGE